jgi:hypothetical protein
LARFAGLIYRAGAAAAITISNSLTLLDDSACRLTGRLRRAG